MREMVLSLRMMVEHISCVIRSSTTGITSETRVVRDNWNGDKLDGSGPSGITASPVPQQMINIEYEWYGAGEVKFSFTIDGETHIIHKFQHANRINQLWCGTPFLPIRCELENVTGVAGTHYMYQGSNFTFSRRRTRKTWNSCHVKVMQLLELQ